MLSSEIDSWHLLKNWEVERKFDFHLAMKDCLVETEIHFRNCKQLEKSELELEKNDFQWHQMPQWKAF